jgi:hypothetical protein
MFMMKWITLCDKQTNRQTDRKTNRQKDRKKRKKGKEAREVHAGEVTFISR